MKRSKSISKPNKYDGECMCQVHLRNDGDKAQPCLGHKGLCPCTKLLEEAKLKKEETPADPLGIQTEKVDTPKENV